MPRLAWRIGVLDRRAVHEMLPAAPAVDRGPEIIEHMAVEADPLARLQPNDPDPHLLVLRKQLTADTAVVQLVFALEFGLDLGRPLTAVLVHRFLVQHGKG